MTISPEDKTELVLIISDDQTQIEAIEMIDKKRCMLCLVPKSLISSSKKDKD